MDEKEKTEIFVKINENHGRIKALENRMDKMEEQSQAINDLALSVKELAVNMNVMNEKQEDQNKRLSVLENKPARRWELVVELVITTLVGALIGFLLSRLGL